ncbi:hypothetical protein VKT23_003670 [Stygiomarasmius scandens]|uniref:RRM domain-containing protein n=1 Tax=Marasmiellus scandens TaxID=2682957 RepID=A0ABR1JYM8_9AGAR
MLVNSLRAGLRHAHVALRPRTVSSRIARLPVTAGTPSSVLCRTFFVSRTVQKQPNDKRVIYLANLPWSIEVDDLKELAERFGTLEQITLPNDESGRFAGFANIVFSRHEDAVALLEHAKSSGAITFNGRRSRVYLMDEPQQVPLPRTGLLTRSGRFGLERFKGSSSLYVGNLPFEVDAERVRDALSSLGEVKRVHISHTREGTNRGFAHVDFASAEEASRVMQEHMQNPIDINGRSLVIDLARPFAGASKTRKDPHHTLFFNKFQGNAEELKELLLLTPKSIKFLPLEVGGGDERKGFIEYENVEQATNVLNAIRSGFQDMIMVDYAKSPAVREREAAAKAQQRGGASKASYGGDWEGGSRSSDYPSSMS